MAIKAAGVSIVVEGVSPARTGRTFGGCRVYLNKTVGLIETVGIIVLFASTVVDVNTHIQKYVLKLYFFCKCINV